MIKVSLRILLVEDTSSDVILIKRKITKIVENPVIEVVDNLEDVKEKMVNFVPDVVISDYNLPTCTGMDVLELAKSIDKNVPFIFLTGTINDEELAANTILAGAFGYILKKHMKTLDEKLEPLLKRVVVNMVTKEELREKIRKNKIAVNQIYSFLDKLKTDNKEQQDNLTKLKGTIKGFNWEEDDK